jgi:hypothetical protein
VLMGHHNHRKHLYRINIGLQYDQRFLLLRLTHEVSAKDGGIVPLFMHACINNATMHRQELVDSDLSIKGNELPKIQPDWSRRVKHTYMFLFNGRVMLIHPKP